MKRLTSSRLLLTALCRSLVTAASLSLLAILAFAGPASGMPPEESDPTVAGMVTTDGVPTDGVTIDLFAGTAEGERTSWLGATVSGQSGPGGYLFDTGQFGHAGPCWILTFIAPPGETFDNQTAWLNRTVCAAPGDNVEGVDANLVLAETSGLIRGEVADDMGQVADLQIDVFAANADGSRGTWRFSELTATDGQYEIAVETGCYILTYIAPESRTFVETDSPWLNRPVCVEAGQVFESSPVQLSQPATDLGVIVGQVLENGSGVPAANVDLFRGDTYLETRPTDDDGVVRFETEAGCYRVIFISPDPAKVFRFGTGFDRRDLCIEAGQQVEIEPAAMLVGISRFAIVDFVHNGIHVADRAIEVYEADSQGTRGQLLTTGTSGASGTVFVELGGSTDCWVARAVGKPDETFVSTDSQFRDDAFCLEDLQQGENRLEISYEVEIAVSEADAPIELGQPSFEEKTSVSGQLDGKPQFYRVTGPPGADLVFSEREDCSSNDDRFFVWYMPTDRSRLRGGELSDPPRCLDFFRTTIPDDGVLLVAVSTDQSSDDLTPEYSFDIRLTSVVRQTVDASNGATISGVFSDIGDGAIYTIEVGPGASLRLDGTANSDATCEDWPGTGRALSYRVVEGVLGPPLGFDPCVDQVYTTGNGDGVFQLSLSASYGLDYIFTASAE